MKILFFAETLFCGGKERRLLELIEYLLKNTDYKLALVITEPLIHYEYVYDLGIPVVIMERKIFKYDPLLFLKFYRYCRSFKPDIIHTWGKMTTFYSIPAKLICRVPIVSSLVADAQRDFKIFSFSYLFFKADILFSDVILSNSQAGLAAYKIKTPKARVILNGVNLERFQQKFNTKEIREEIGRTNSLVVIMVAAFTKYKDYDLFLDIAKEIRKYRNDVTFVGVGDGNEWDHIQKRITDEQLDNIILTGKKNNVEPIIAASDIGILCTYSEGISNSIIEYMALGKPAISTEIIGGSKELIVEGVTGYCTDRNIEEILGKLNSLLDNPELRVSMGDLGRRRIYSHFSIDRMSEDFRSIYQRVLAQKINK